jgi:hypothetical protein
LASSRELLVHLVRTRDRTTLGCIDDCPPGTAWIDFVAPTDVVKLDGGKFFPEHDQIDVYRDGAPSNPRGAPVEAAAASQNPTEELVWLAHELGHLHSKLRGNPSPPPADIPEQVYAEELRAWAFAWQLLREEGFSEWKTFDALRDHGLGSYLEHLRLSASQVRAATALVEASHAEPNPT